MVDCVNEEGEPEDVGEEDEFVGVTSDEICPTWTRKFRAAIHSSVLNLVSRREVVEVGY